MNKTEQLLLINRICDEFESNLKMGLPADIDQVLDSVRGESTSEYVVEELFVELVTLQLAYSDDPDSTVMELKSKYPERSSVIEFVKSQSSLNSNSRAYANDTKSGEWNFSLPPARTIDRLGSRFENLEYLASGGLGDVYTGYDNSVKRRVAIKLLKSNLVSKPNARRRFLNEAAITGGLEHPGIVPIYDSGISEDGRPYCAMRLFRGRTMKEHIKELHSRRNDPDFSQQQRSLIRSLADISKAVSYAHDNEVIHRDLKPANIMLGDYGESIVIDWGLARKGSEPQDAESDEEAMSINGSSWSESDSRLTRTGAVLGTPGYMSPEQASGNSSSVGVPADIYSLGAVLYTIITGVNPKAGRKLDLSLIHISEPTRPY